MEWLRDLAMAREAPALAAFALGLLTAVAPCPLATNISATAYIARELKYPRAALISGLLYTIGRALSYSVLGMVLYWGASKFHVARFFQSNGELFLGPILVLLGLVLLGVIKIGSGTGDGLINRFTERFKDKGHLGALVLGVLFALAFCPYSGALFFGSLIPMTLAPNGGLHLPVIFAIGTGLPVMLFSVVMAYSANQLGRVFKAVRQVEKVMRYVAGVVFVLTGLYYIGIFMKVW
ncbi:MAG TPA: aromatic aminobenezylarsenical efflux permease ArsG family transporter [Flavobacteriales bacterium]|nr:aromatic aminobenezylarsenical efflux permease ArsG family transporter [Flavobacteriales bacterium]HMR28707.1 aromatic aminobenezylarsenical efflux permease ArsG family transporter [Flavobacteriales bacterium]